MMTLRQVLAAMCVLALAAGCTAAATPSGALSAAQTALGPTGPTLGGQRAGDVLVWLSSTPEQPQRGSASIDAYLVDPEGQPVDDATVTFDTDMTNMSHGEYLVATEPVGNGHYVGQVHFSMPGPWRVIAVVERPGIETVNLRFEFDVGAS